MGTLKAVANRSEAFLQNFQSLFPGGGDPDDRYAQFRLQPPQINCDACRRGLIHQIDAEHDALRSLHDLKRQQQTPLQVRRVADRERTAEVIAHQKFRRNLLLAGTALQRVGPRKIGQCIFCRLIDKCPLRQRNGLPRPVSGVLPLAGQRVEERALADVRVARQRDQASFVPPPRHVHGSVRIRAASLFRIAITAPRTA